MPVELKDGFAVAPATFGALVFVIEICAALIVGVVAAEPPPPLPPPQAERIKVSAIATVNFKVFMSCPQLCFLCLIGLQQGAE